MSRIPRTILLTIALLGVPATVASASPLTTLAAAKSLGATTALNAAVAQEQEKSVVSDGLSIANSARTHAASTHSDPNTLLSGLAQADLYSASQARQSTTSVYWNLSAQGLITPPVACVHLWRNTSHAPVVTLGSCGGPVLKASYNPLNYVDAVATEISPLITLTLSPSSNLAVTVRLKGSSSAVCLHFAPAPVRPPYSVSTGACA